MRTKMKNNKIFPIKTKAAAVLCPQLHREESSLIQTPASDASNVPAQAQHYTGMTAHLQVIKQWIEL